MNLIFSKSKQGSEDTSSLMIQMLLHIKDKNGRRGT